MPKVKTVHATVSERATPSSSLALRDLAWYFRPKIYHFFDGHEEDSFMFFQSDVYRGASLIRKRPSPLGSTIGP